MQQQSVFCHMYVVDVLSSFNASASLAACGGHVCARPPIAYLNFTSQSLHLPSLPLASTVKLWPLTFFRMEAILLTCIDNPSSFTHSLCFYVVELCASIIPTFFSLLLSWNLWLNESVSFFFLAGSLHVSARTALSPLLSNVSPLLLLIRVNEMVPFTHPIWARPWNTPCFVKRWRGRTFDLQKPPDNYLFTYLCIYCWH